MSKNSPLREEGLVDREIIDSCRNIDESIMALRESEPVLMEWVFSASDRDAVELIHEGVALNEKTIEVVLRLFYRARLEGYLIHQRVAWKHLDSLNRKPVDQGKEDDCDTCGFMLRIIDMGGYEGETPPPN